MNSNNWVTLSSDPRELSVKSKRTGSCQCYYEEGFAHQIRDPFGLKKWSLNHPEPGLSTASAPIDADGGIDDFNACTDDHHDNNESWFDERSDSDVDMDESVRIIASNTRMESPSFCPFMLRPELFTYSNSTFG